MTHKFYIEDLKSDYKKVTVMCIHIGLLLPSFPAAIIMPELQKFFKEINRLSLEFKNIYDEIPWASIVNTGTKITIKDVEDNSNLFLELKILIEKSKKDINELCYQEMKKLKPKWSTDYKHPIKAKYSVKPLKK